MCHIVDTDMPSDPPCAGLARIRDVKPADPQHTFNDQHLAT